MSIKEKELQDATVSEVGKLRVVTRDGESRDVDYDEIKSDIGGGGGGSDGLMVVTATLSGPVDDGFWRFSKTWQEIYDAINAGTFIAVSKDDGARRTNTFILSVGQSGTEYELYTANTSERFHALNPDDTGFYRW